MEKSALETFRLDKMVKGWFVGDFSPAALRTDAAEVAVKHYKAGDREETHLHKIASEITLVLEGIVEMCGQRLSEGDIIKLAPGEATDFLAVTDATTVVIKLPSVIGDRYVA
jgi:quercetin dioxygenase-like cupin family protein